MFSDKKLAVLRVSKPLISDQNVIKDAGLEVTLAKVDQTDTKPVTQPGTTTLGVLLVLSGMSPSCVQFYPVCVTE